MKILALIQPLFDFMTILALINTTIVGLHDNLAFINPLLNFMTILALTLLDFMTILVLLNPLLDFMTILALIHPPLNCTTILTSYPIVGLHDSFGPHTPIVGLHDNLALIHPPLNCTTILALIHPLLDCTAILALMHLLVYSTCMSSFALKHLFFDHMLILAPYLLVLSSCLHMCLCLAPEDGWVPHASIVWLHVDLCPHCTFLPCSRPFLHFLPHG